MAGFDSAPRQRSNEGEVSHHSIDTNGRSGWDHASELSIKQNTPTLELPIVDQWYVVTGFNANFSSCLLYTSDAADE